MNTSSVDIHSFEKLRPLGALEQFSSARHDLGFYNNVGITATYSSSIQSPIDLKDVIFSALAIVIQRHPILSTIPVDENTTNPYFARLPEVNLENAVTFIVRESPLVENARDIELDELLEAQHNISFKAGYGSLPFWRLIILTHPDPGMSNEFVASFIYHHSLGDGGSGIIFHKHLRSALSSSCTTSISNKIIKPSTDFLLPNLELLLPLPLAARNITSQPSTRPTTTKQTPTSLWTGGKVTIPLVNHFHSLTFSRETSALLLEACRAHDATLTSLLPIIIASSITELIPTTFTTLECTIPINIRPWLPSVIDADSFGVWIDALSFYLRREGVGAFSWDEVRRAREVIVEYLAGRGEKVNVLKFKEIADMRAWLKGMVGKERGSSFDVSNLGVVRGNVEGEAEGGGEDGVAKRWDIGRVVFSRSAWVSGSAFTASVVTGGDGCLVLGFVWQEGVVGNEFVKRIVELVEKQIEVLASEMRSQ